MLSASHIHLTEGTILHDPDQGKFTPFAVGSRKRLATCSGVAWLGNNHLAVVNLYGGHLRVYRFSPASAEGLPSFTLLHEQKEGISFPENVAASPDGSMLAVASSLSNTHGIALFGVNAERSLGLACQTLRMGTFHGIGFSPDSRHLAFTEIGGTGYIEVVDPLRGKTTSMLANRLFPLKPKGLAFTPDGQFLAITSAMNVSVETEWKAHRSVISFHRYQARSGVVDELPVAEYVHESPTFSSIENLTIVPTTTSDSYRLLVVDQANDQLLAFSFNERTNQIAFGGVLSANLFFPHGIAASPDGRHVATANYGDDSLRVFRLPVHWPEPPNLPQAATETHQPRLVSNEERLPFSPFFLPGHASPHPDKATLLLCGHAAETELFGAERSLLDLLDAFSAIRWNVIVTLPSARNRAYIERVRRLCHGIHIFAYKQFGHNTPSALSVAMFGDIISRHNISVVHVNTTTLFEPLLAARHKGVLSIVHVREILMSDLHILRQYGQSVSSLLGRITGLADFFIGNSGICQSAFSKYKRTFLLHNCVDLDLLDTPNECNEQIRFGLLSSNLPKKGIYDFVEIARICRQRGLNAEFLLFGPANQFVEGIKREMEAGKIVANLHFKGYAESCVEALKQINVLLCLTQIPESFGRSVAEALAARRPVIAYRLGALPELIQHNTSGFLIPNQDILAASAAVGYLCANPALIPSMGAKGRASMMKSYSRSSFATTLDRLYASLPLSAAQQTSLSA